MAIYFTHEQADDLVDALTNAPFIGYAKVEQDEAGEISIEIIDADEVKR